MAKTENELSYEIIKAAIEVHKTLGGPGLLESIYEEALYVELVNSGLHVEKQIEFPVVYKKNKLDKKLRIDILVENKVVVECKAVSEFNEIFLSQCLTYLRISGLKLGLVINFGERRLKEGIYRVVNGL